MFDTLHPDEIEDILFSHYVGHLACISSGAPYVVPITYAYAGGDLYGMTQPGRKVTAMRDSPAVAFSIVDLTDPRRWRSVIVEGTYAEVEDRRERERAVALLADISPKVRIENGSIVFRISPSRRSGRWVHTA
jgi:uncharacterized protein